MNDQQLTALVAALLLGSAPYGEPCPADLSQADAREIATGDAVAHAIAILDEVRHQHATQLKRPTPRIGGRTQ